MEMTQRSVNWVTGSVPRWLEDVARDTALSHNCRNRLCQDGYRGARFIVRSFEQDWDDFRLCVCVFKPAQSLTGLPGRVDSVLTARKKWGKGEAWAEFCSFQDVENFSVSATVLTASGHLFSFIFFLLSLCVAEAGTQLTVFFWAATACIVDLLTGSASLTVTQLSLWWRSVC